MTSKTCYEFAVYSVKPAFIETFIGTFPEIRRLLAGQAGFGAIQTFRDTVNPEIFVDMATWSSPEHMQRAGEAIMGSAEGQRLFAPMDKVLCMDATLPVFKAGNPDPDGPVSLIIYARKTDPAAFETVRDTFYHDITRVPGVGIEQFESAGTPGRYFDVFRSPSNPELQEQLKSYYESDLMKQFESAMETPEFMATLAPVSVQLESLQT